MSPVKEADPSALALEAAFAEAMGAPARPLDPPAPKEIDPEAPHGRDDQGKPLAPYGLTKDGKPKRTAAGRPAKDDQARTAPPASPGDAGKDDQQLAEPGQYNKQLSDTADGLWLALSCLGKAGPDIPLIGKLIPAQRIQAQAAVWFATKDRAVAAISLAAEHNAAAARFARKLEGGDITWVITCMSLVMPVLSASELIWSKDADKKLAELEQPSLAELAARNEKELEAAIAKMTAATTEAAEQQVASLNGSEPA